MDIKCKNCECNLGNSEREEYPNEGVFCDVYCYRELFKKNEKVQKNTD